MPTPWSEVFAALGDRLDETVLPRLYEAASLSTAEIRAELDREGLRRFDPGQPDLMPSGEELRSSVDAVQKRALRRVTLRGAVAGAGGLFTLPPEAVVSLVQTLHLGQRLAVIYGHDPETDAGRILLLRAMAEAVQVQLPRQNRLSLKVSELPQLASHQLAAAGEGRSLLPLVVSRAAVTLVGRMGRIVPGFGAGFSAWQARRTGRQHAERMAAVFARAWTGAPFGDDTVEDAIELG